MVRIGIVGDYRPANPTHVATEAALEHAGAAAGVELEHAWVPTPWIAAGPEAALAGLDAVLIAPGSPYESIDGALTAIEAARAGDLPLLGTCGGLFVPQASSVPGRPHPLLSAFVAAAARISPSAVPAR